MSNISAQLEHTRALLDAAARSCDRDPNTITLLAVSKKQSAKKIKEAFNCGHIAFGENYLQEALEKINILATLNLQWHFIGSIQSNKTREISENFDWVHTIDRLKIARRLNDQRPPHLAPINLCIQVNIDNEPSKAGVSADEVKDLALEITHFKNISLRGLMAIPAKQAKPDQQHHAFACMQALFNDLKRHPSLCHLDTLSMGMSADYESAITYGATIVRVGTAIFGSRE